MIRPIDVILGSVIACCVIKLSCIAGGAALTHLFPTAQKQCYVAKCWAVDADWSDTIKNADHPAMIRDGYTMQCDEPVKQACQGGTP